MEPGNLNRDELRMPEKLEFTHCPNCAAQLGATMKWDGENRLTIAICPETALWNHAGLDKDGLYCLNCDARLVSKDLFGMGPGTLVAKNTIPLLPIVDEE